jgi:hypothetical protein
MVPENELQRSRGGARVSQRRATERATSVHPRATSVAATPYNPRVLHAGARTPFGALPRAPARNGLRPATTPPWHLLRKAWIGKLPEMSIITAI